MLCNEFGASLQPKIMAEAALEILKAAVRMPVMDATTEGGSMFRRSRYELPPLGETETVSADRTFSSGD